MSFYIFLCLILYRYFVILCNSYCSSFCRVTPCCRIFVALSFGGLADVTQHILPCSIAQTVSQFRRLKILWKDVENILF